jgi:hypothetical protein
MFSYRNSLLIDGMREWKSAANRDARRGFVSELAEPSNNIAPHAHDFFHANLSHLE